MRSVKNRQGFEFALDSFKANPIMSNSTVHLCHSLGRKMQYSHVVSTTLFCIEVYKRTTLSCEDVGNFDRNMFFQFLVYSNCGNRGTDIRSNVTIPHGIFHFDNYPKMHLMIWKGNHFLSLGLLFRHLL